MNERHDPSSCRRILREAREDGLSRKLFDEAQDLQDGIYRAEALCGLCASSEMDEDDRFEWVPIIVNSMIEEERAWRLAESIGIIAKSLGNWPGGRSRKGLMDDLVAMTGGLPPGEARVDALRAISNRVSEHKLPELFLLAIENDGMEAKAVRPVMKAIVSSKNMEMISEIMPLLSEAAPDLAVKFLDNLHRLSNQYKLKLEPSALQLSLPHLDSADFETVRTLCSHTSEIDDVKLLAEALDGTDENATRYAVTLAGRADRAGDADYARKLLESAAKNVESLDAGAATRISKNLAKAFARMGDDERAEQLKPVRTPSIVTANTSDGDVGRKGHTMALVGTYDGSIGTPHLRALARASGIAWGFGLDIALIDWPTDDLEGLCQRAQQESGTAGVGHLPALFADERIRLLSIEDVLNGMAGHPIATTHQPAGGSVNLSEFKGDICMIIGLGRQGLPKNILEKCPNQFELTGIGASLETAVAMGAIAQRLADL
ncbi:MAG: DUF531 family protein [Candidatus Thermoplasmatota archaeon]|nr:DUF531 family protein [Candidatus Thermoplasmatota archaeon]